MGTRKNEKGQRFEFLIHRIEEAIKKGFYVEAMTITYALFEERTYRLLDRLHLQYNTNDKLYSCLSKLEEAIKNRTITVATKQMTLNGLMNMMSIELINNNLISDIQAWRIARNKVIHDLAKMTINYNSLKSTAIRGKDLFKNYSAFIMRIKRQIDVKPSKFRKIGAVNPH